MRLSAPACLIILSLVSAKSYLSAQSADEQLNILPQWNEAQSAHRDGLSEIVILKLNAIRQLASLAPEAQTRIRHLLVESLARSGRYEEALANAQGNELPFWKGLSHAMLGRLSDAHPLLLQCATNKDHVAQEEAILTLASTLNKLEGVNRAGEFLAGEINKPENKSLSPRPRLALVELHIEQGKNQAALNTLAAFGDELSPILRVSANLLEARALIALKKYENAQSKLREILAQQQSIPGSTINAASLLLADAASATATPEDAVVILTGVIENAPSGGNVLPAFDRLGDAGFFEVPDGVALLKKWRESPKAEASRPASLFAAAESKNSVETRQDAIQILNELKMGDDPVAIRANLLLAEILIEGADKKGALSVMNELKQLTDNASVMARIDFVEAKAKYTTGEFESAADRFGAITGGDAADVASYNAAVSSLRAGNDQKLLARAALLPEVTGQFSRGELELERALYKCSNRDPDAGSALSEFLRNHPKHKRRAEAYLASAATNVLYGPLNVESARDNLKKALSLELTAQSFERADYIAFWIEEIAGDHEQAIRNADRFISKWPKSEHAPGVRMRQAEIQFRASDYLDAMRNFEKLSIEYPDSELSDKAMFFAGRASMLTLTEEGAQRALTFWQKLTEIQSPLAPLGRHHQAQIKLSQGEQEEALTILDAALVDEPEPRLKALILILKGRALYELGGKDDTRLTQAINVFAQALLLEDVSLAIRHEILFRKAKAHELMREFDQTLSCLHEVMKGRANTQGKDAPNEFKWYYRAGFEAIRIKESAGGQQNIIAAIAIADRLARTPGPRADEARKTGQRLRLEHFIWQE